MRASATLLALLLSLSGCASDAKPAATSSAPGPIALGAIEGDVLDAEQLPLPGTQVQLVEAGAKTKTGPDGAFRFEGVLAGSHTLAVDAAGYRPHRTRVDVAADATAKVQVLLEPAALAQPYVEVLIFDGYIQQGNEYLDVVTTSLGVDGCTRCRFHFNASGDVEALVSEILFSRTIDNPHGPEVLAYGLFNHDMSQRYTPPGQYWPSGGRFEIDRRWGPEGARLLHTHGCDDLWFCVDQRFTNHVSLFHLQRPSGDYSALPDG